MKKSLLYFSLLVAILIGGYLRLYKLGSIPWALNRDEASIGYTAYSILHTGTDEHGVAWPINIESFGDWKLPVYMYASLPFVAAFGLEPWVVRLPSALAGIALIPLAYYFVISFKIKNLEEKKIEYIGILAAWLIAVSPWSVRLSRIAYEANVALVLAVIGITLIVRSLNTKKPGLLFLGLFVSLSTLLTYHAYQVFMPIMLLVLLVHLRKEGIALIKKQPYVLIGSIAVVALFAALLILGNTSHANTTKFSGLSIFSEETHHTRLFEKRISFVDQTGLLAKVYANSGTMILENIEQNIAALFSLTFLFVNGGTHGSHDISGIGNVYWITGFFSVVALISLTQHSTIKMKHSVVKLLLFWLLAASIAPLITVEAAHSIRFSPALFSFEVLAAIGFVTTLDMIKNNHYKVVAMALAALILFFSVFQVVVTYFVIYPQRDVQNWRWYSKEVSADVFKLKSEYAEIYMPQVDSSPYIFLLFDWQYPPEKLAKNLKYYPTDSGGFTHASQLENIFFERIDWSDFISSPERKLLFIEKFEFDKQNISENDFQIIKKYETKNSNASYYLISNE